MVIDKRLTPDTVAQLQASCEELLGVKLQLADYLTEPGVLVIERGSINPDMFRVACVAHELFDMAAVDQVHREGVYPEPDWASRMIETSRLMNPDWDEAPRRQMVELFRETPRESTEFKQGVIQRVRAAREQRRGERGTLSTS